MSFLYTSSRDSRYGMNDNILLWLILGVAALIGIGLLYQYAQPPDRPPIADFDFLAQEEDAKIRAGMRVHFYNQSEDPEGEELACQWDFGDGESSSEISPSHVFWEPKDFHVLLEVLDKGGNLRTKERVVRVLPAGPIASFEVKPTNPVANSIVTFADNSFHPSKNAIIKKTWIFDLAEPDVLVARGGSEFREEKVYSRPGTYKVKLTVEDDQGLTDSCIREVVVSDLTTSIARLDQSIAGLNTGIEELRLQIKEFGITLDSVSRAMVSLDTKATKVIEEYKEKGMSALAWASILIALMFGVLGAIAFILQIIAWRRGRQQI